MSKRVIIVEFKDGKSEGYVIDWSDSHSLRNLAKAEWMDFGGWKMIRSEDVKSLTLLPEEVEDEPKPFTPGGYVTQERIKEIWGGEQIKPIKFLEKAMNNPEYKAKSDKFMKESIDEVLNNRVDKANEKKESGYGWDMDLMKSLKERQDKEQEKRERPMKEEAERKKRRKEMDLQGLIKTFDEVFWFIRKYNTKGIEEMKKHNDLYISIREELDKAHEEKYKDLQKKE